MTKKITTISIESEIWKDLKKYCIDKDISLSEVIENLIRGLLNNEGTKKETSI